MTETWTVDPTREEEMEEGHTASWDAMINLSGETDLTESKVLDFGCNRGGFLRRLYSLSPFEEGIGIDVASGSIEKAMQARGSLPITYLVCHNVGALPFQFDVAFSHEVIYLLPELKDHAEKISSRLNSGGRYHIALSCHTANPLWPRWKELLRSHTHTPTYDYSPTDICAAFQKAGFEIEWKPFGDAVDLSTMPHELEPWFPSLSSLEEFYRKSFLLFSAVRP